MNLFKLTLLEGVTALVFLLSSPHAYAGNEACKVLTPEKFGEIMGYKAAINSASEGTCIYKGPGEAGGMLMIITDKAMPRTKDMLDAQGPTPFGKNGKLGYSYLKGTTLFSVGITGTDPAKVNALADEVKRNLK